MKSRAELTPAERLLNRCSWCLMPPMIMQTPCGNAARKWPAALRQLQGRRPVHSRVWRGCSRAKSQWAPLWRPLHNTWCQRGVPATTPWCRRSSRWWSRRWRSPLLPLQNYSVQTGYTHKRRNLLALTCSLGLSSPGYIQNKHYLAIPMPMK